MAVNWATSSRSMREQYTRFKLLNRYSMDLAEFFSISSRAKGWKRAFLKILWRYWSDRYPASHAA